MGDLSVKEVTDPEREREREEEELDTRQHNEGTLSLCPHAHILSHTYTSALLARRLPVCTIFALGLIHFPPWCHSQRDYPSVNFDWLMPVFVCQLPAVTHSVYCCPAGAKDQMTLPGFRHDKYPRAAPLVISASIFQTNFL